ncbi:MAG: hypothetical protein K2I17_00845 [Clostridia bacterium]|nr:hypothetical protein [Clostridia bacterium]
MASLSTQDFELELNVIGGYDARLTVKGKNYSGAVSYDISEHEYNKFKKDLTELYKTLKEGEAVLNEDYGNGNFIKFVSDGLGHFIVSGKLYDYRKYWRLSFTETVDQTYLKSFIAEL